MNAEAPISGRLRFDPVLTWGHVLLFIGFAINGIGVWIATELRATDLSYRIAALECVADDAKEANRDILKELKTLNTELTNIKINMGAAPRASLTPPPR